MAAPVHTNREVLFDRPGSGNPWQHQCTLTVKSCFTAQALVAMAAPVYTNSEVLFDHMAAPVYTNREVLFDRPGSGIHGSTSVH